MKTVIMGLIQKLNQQKPVTENNSLPKNDNNLTSEEIVFLLESIKEFSFKGKEINILYNTIIKLQNQYTNLNSTK